MTRVSGEKVESPAVVSRPGARAEKNENAAGSSRPRRREWFGLREPNRASAERAGFDFAETNKFA